MRFIGPKHAALIQERVHKRGLAGIDVRDDGDIDDFFFFAHDILLSLFEQSEISLRGFSVMPVNR